jgi:magnesium transporter
MAAGKPRRPLMPHQTIRDHGAMVADDDARALADQETDLPETTEAVVQVEGAAARHPQMPQRQSPVTIWVFAAGADPRQIALDELPAVVADDANFAWVDLSNYAEADLHEVARLLDLHDLGVQAALAPWQRPRIAAFGEHFFVATTVVEVDNDSYQVRARQLDLFVGPNFLVSTHKQPLPFADQLLTRARQNPRLVELDSSFMLYNILGQLLDAYENLAEQLEDELERLEERALTTTADAFLEDLLHFKRYIFALSRLASQHQTIFTAVLRADFPFVSDEQTAPYFRDVADQFMRLRDTLLAAKEAVNGAFDIYVSHVSHRTNQSMKLLTMVSTTLLPITAILGFFGTNFQGLPLYTSSAFWIMLVIVAVVAALILSLFHRRGWF